MSNAVQRLFHGIPVEIMPHPCQMEGVLGGTRWERGVCLLFLSKVADYLLALLLEGNTKQRLVMTDHEPGSLVPWFDGHRSSFLVKNGSQRILSVS
jgi:hypothetical protein